MTATKCDQVCTITDGAQPSTEPKLEILDPIGDAIEAIAHMQEGQPARSVKIESTEVKAEKSCCEEKTERWMVRVKISAKSAARLMRILNSRPISLQRLGMSGVRLDSTGEMISVKDKVEEVAKAEAARCALPSPRKASPPRPSQVGKKKRKRNDADTDSSVNVCKKIKSGVASLQQSLPPCDFSSRLPQLGETTEESIDKAISPNPRSHLIQQQIQQQHQQMQRNSDDIVWISPMASVPPSPQQQEIPRSQYQPHQPQQQMPQAPALVNLLNTSQITPPSIRSLSQSPFTPGGSGISPTGESPPFPSARLQNGIFQQGPSMAAIQPNQIHQSPQQIQQNNLMQYQQNMQQYHQQQVHMQQQMQQQRHQQMMHRQQLNHQHQSQQQHQPVHQKPTIHEFMEQHRQQQQLQQQQRLHEQNLQLQRMLLEQNQIQPPQQSMQQGHANGQAMHQQQQPRQPPHPQSHSMPDQFDQHNHMNHLPMHHQQPNMLLQQQQAQQMPMQSTQQHPNPYDSIHHLQQQQQLQLRDPLQQQHIRQRRNEMQQRIAQGLPSDGIAAPTGSLPPLRPMFPVHQKRMDTSRARALPKKPKQPQPPRNQASTRNIKEKVQKRVRDAEQVQRILQGIHEDMRKEKQQQQKQQQQQKIRSPPSNSSILGENNEDERSSSTVSVLNTTSTISPIQQLQSQRQTHQQQPQMRPPPPPASTLHDYGQNGESALNERTAMSKQQSQHQPPQHPQPLPQRMTPDEDAQNTGASDAWDDFADLDEIVPMGYSTTPRDVYGGVGHFTSTPTLRNEHHDPNVQRQHHKQSVLPQEQQQRHPRNRLDKNGNQRVHDPSTSRIPDATPSDVAARARMLVQQGGRVSYDAAYQHKMPTQRANEHPVIQHLDQQENGGSNQALTQPKMASPTRKDGRCQQPLRSMQSIQRREQMRSPPPPVQRNQS